MKGCDCGLFAFNRPFASVAMRTVSSLCTFSHQCFPFVSLFAEPPDFLLGTKSYVGRGQLAVFKRMPLFGQPGEDGGQIIVALLDSSVGAVGTASVIVRTAVHCCLPLVPSFALPPHPYMETRGDIKGSEVAIFGGVPLAGEIGLSVARSL